VSLRPLPFEDSDRLVQLTEIRGGRQGRVPKNGRAVYRVSMSPDGTTILFDAPQPQTGDLMLVGPFR
jgi:hypothetical protein